MNIIHSIAYALGAISGQLKGRGIIKQRDRRTPEQIAEQNRVQVQIELERAAHPLTEEEFGAAMDQAMIDLDKEVPPL